MTTSKMATRRRRHRPTVWKLWGVPQAINAGDGMFALAFSAIQRLAELGVTAEGTLRALRIFTDTCVEFTEGQHLDMLFRAARCTSASTEYLRMIQGKTAALMVGAVGGDRWPWWRGAPAAHDQAHAPLWPGAWDFLFRFRMTSSASGATRR
jgi:hypothetical protein